jgi:aryl-alcohol dehydrogenase-like predicted oxidoreductase
MFSGLVGLFEYVFIYRAVNYRSMRSERAVGNAVATALAQGIVTRNQVVVCTKGGYFTFDGNRPANLRQWIQENFVAKGIFSWSEFAAGCHCMTPAYLKNQVKFLIHYLSNGSE